MRFVALAFATILLASGVSGCATVGGQRASALRSSDYRAWINLWERRPSWRRGDSTVFLRESQIVLSRLWSGVVNDVTSENLTSANEKLEVLQLIRPRVRALHALAADVDADGPGGIRVQLNGLPWVSRAVKMAMRIDQGDSAIALGEVRDLMRRGESGRWAADVLLAPRVDALVYEFQQGLAFLTEREVNRLRSLEILVLEGGHELVRSTVGEQTTRVDQLGRLKRKAIDALESTASAHRQQHEHAIEFGLRRQSLVLAAPPNRQAAQARLDSLRREAIDHHRRQAEALLGKGASEEGLASLRRLEGIVEASVLGELESNYRRRSSGIEGRRALSTAHKLFLSGSHLDAIEMARHADSLLAIDSNTIPVSDGPRASAVPASREASRRVAGERNPQASRKDQGKLKTAGVMEARIWRNQEARELANRALETAIEYRARKAYSLLDQSKPEEGLEVLGSLSEIADQPRMERLEADYRRRWNAKEAARYRTLSHDQFGRGSYGDAYYSALMADSLLGGDPEAQQLARRALKAGTRRIVVLPIRLDDPAADELRDLSSLTVSMANALKASAGPLVQIVPTGPVEQIYREFTRRRLGRWDMASIGREFERRLAADLLVYARVSQYSAHSSWGSPTRKRACTRRSWTTTSYCTVTDEWGRIFVDYCGRPIVRETESTHYAYTPVSYDEYSGSSSFSMSIEVGLYDVERVATVSEEVEQLSNWDSKLRAEYAGDVNKLCNCPTGPMDDSSIRTDWIEGKDRFSTYRSSLADPNLMARRAMETLLVGKSSSYGRQLAVRGVRAQL